MGYGEKKTIIWQVLLISHNFPCAPIFPWSYFTDMYTIRSDEIYQKWFQAHQKIMFPSIYSTWGCIEGNIHVLYNEIMVI